MLSLPTNATSPTLSNDSNDDAMTLAELGIECLVDDHALTTDDQVRFIPAAARRSRYRATMIM